MTDSVIKASMSYETTRQYKNYIENKIKKTIGLENLTYINSSYSILINKSLDVPIKYNRNKLILKIKTDYIGIFIKGDF